MKRLIQEPLVHFIALAIAIFGLYQLVSSQRHDADRTIVVTQADMERLASLYAVEAGALPTRQDMRAIVSDQIQQEALAREAERLGMAEDDTVVQRRLAQKMTFMLSDLEQIAPPSDQVLEDWLDQNRSRFEEPLRLSFDHVFFSSDRDERIDSAIEKLASDIETDWRAQGDPFMLQRRYARLPQREIVRLFGSAFATSLAALKPDEDGAWQGPLVSALGTHLVRINTRDRQRLPALEAIRPSVLQDWREHEQRRQTSDAIAAIVDKYEIVIEGTEDN